MLLGELAGPAGVTVDEGRENRLVLGEGGRAPLLGLVREGAVAGHLPVDLAVQPARPRVPGDLGDGEVEVVTGVHGVLRQLDQPLVASDQRAQPLLAGGVETGGRLGAMSPSSTARTE